MEHGTRPRNDPGRGLGALPPSESPGGAIVGIPASLVPARECKPSELEAGKVLFIPLKKRKTQPFTISLRHSAGPFYFGVDNAYAT
jgi:hypothetical protein